MGRLWPLIDALCTKNVNLASAPVVINSFGIDVDILFPDSSVYSIYLFVKVLSVALFKSFSNVFSSHDSHTDCVAFNDMETS